MSHELPSGWASVCVGDVVESLKYGTAQKCDYPKHGVPVLRIPNVANGNIDHSDLKYADLPRRELEQLRLSGGDILLIRSNGSVSLVGKTALVREAESGFTYAGYLIRLRPMRSVVEPKFLNLSLGSFATRLQIELEARSTSGVNNINSEEVRALRLALPPLPEQRRIVAKLETLLGNVDASQQRLAKIPVLLKRFRQSVLAAACSGRLTADWREDNPSDDATEDDELPRGWRRTTVEDLTPKGGIFDGPFGSNLKSDDYTESGVRVIRLENIGQLRFIGEKETFISREKYETLKRHTVGEGDIIFASFIMEEVRACVLPKFSTKAVAKADCFCLRPNPQLVDRQYLIFQLISQKSYNALVGEVHGATRPRINTTQLRKLEVRICSLPEQQEIVRRVEGLFALADKLELRLAKARKQVDQLTPSLLARAFAGKLVPQDPADEPASVLLERIKAAQASAPPQRKSKATISKDS